jgi:formylglycine-generating enzyme required for sulfatase activity
VTDRYAQTGRYRVGLCSVALAVALTVVFAGVLAVAACSSDDDSDDVQPPRAVVTLRTVQVGDPGNEPAAIVPFHPGVYASCDEAPSRKAGCELVGAVDDEFEIGELEVTVGQYVAFLNTVDPDGENRSDLYVDSMSPSNWPKYGSIRRSTDSSAPRGTHYSVAYPEWQNKPIGFANFPRAASFANSLTNGDVLARDESSEGGFDVVTYTVRLSPESEQGMYDLRSDQGSGATRSHSQGFVIPSQDEWIKAAYYDHDGSETPSYWVYPTGPRTAPTASVLGPSGDVVNETVQPLSTYSPRGKSAGAVPTWCPSQAGDDCETVNPLGLSSGDYQSKFQANLSTAGQTRTRSPWGTLDQGGNVVEWTDTIAPAPGSDSRVWRRAHGGVANAPAYQLWISAIGRTPEANVGIERINPWQGFRIGAIGTFG